MSQSSKKWALGAIIAGIAGYIAGILTAPKSGKETRQDIKDAAEQGMAEAEKQLKKLHTQMSDLLGQAKDSKHLKGYCSTRSADCHRQGNSRQGKSTTAFERTS
jgi:gas vesicle protein